MSTTAVPEKAKTARFSRRQLIAAGVVLAVIALAVFGWHWWTVGRFIESTDDAYVRADVVTVSSRVSGYVTQVAVDDNQPVKRGDVLVRLDDRDYRAKVDDAQAAVAAADATLQAEQAAAATLDAQIGQQRSQIAQADADAAAARAEAARRDADATRYKQLLAESAASGQRWEQAHADALKARAELTRAGAAVRVQTDQQTVLQRRREQSTAAIAQARARLAAAQAKLALAQLDLDHTVIRATRDGSVGQRAVRAGQYVEVGMPLLAVVPLSDVYVVANFKETQLGVMHDGQPVQIDVDTYSGHTLHGRVIGLAPGSGAQFALLPPDNATGNFTKIVQRIPVKIRVDAPPAGVVLRPGMSVIARVDTRGTQGAGT
ncbi:HlyD family secretion protein [Burkholderia cenocepacia]|uniref:HlyD family secretion protein n=1 Tax=Burkholderia cenocepacia TaxID=95486 RepID=UPI00196A4F8E|nr:HlyD family secretion protein [Burkholderia cenocepacia]MBN3565488.1 HlyD family secretion protein [Burkholderia cenocepacia]MBR8110961.1 HlyD family secretion protein [Burkholderia cenocepacia]